MTTVAAEGNPGGGVKQPGKKMKPVSLGVAAAIAFGNAGKEVATGGGVEGGGGGGGDVNGSRLTGVDLLDMCERLESDNVGLRQRLAKLELQTMQKEHGDDAGGELDEDSRLAPVNYFDSLVCCIRSTPFFQLR